MKRVLLCAALLTWSAMASAVVYKWVDAQGKLMYGDTPPDGVHAEVVEMPGSHAASTTPVRPPPPGAKTPVNPATHDDGAQKAVDNDVAQTREKQCTDAQARYKTLIEGRKLYKAGTDGERQYLTSEEIDSQRVEAKRDVDTICNSPT